MVAYKNLDISFFRFVTMHAFDRLTERPSPYRALHYMQSHGKSECGSGLPSGVISIAYTHWYSLCWLTSCWRLTVQVVDDWQYISLIFDRLLLYIYAIVTLAGTLAILMYAPHIFTDFDQQAFKREITIERCCKGQDDPASQQQCFDDPVAAECIKWTITVYILCCSHARRQDGFSSSLGDRSLPEGSMGGVR